MSRRDLWAECGRSTSMSKFPCSRVCRPWKMFTPAPDSLRDPRGLPPPHGRSPDLPRHGSRVPPRARRRPPARPPSTPSWAWPKEQRQDCGVAHLQTSHYCHHRRRSTLKWSRVCPHTHGASNCCHPVQMRDQALMSDSALATSMISPHNPTVRPVATRPGGRGAVRCCPGCPS